MPEKPKRTKSQKDFQDRKKLFTDLFLAEQWEEG